QGYQTPMFQNDSIEIGGARVLVLKQHFNPTRGGALSSDQRLNALNDTLYIYIKGLPKGEMLDTANRCVLIDPGQGDLLYCMHEASSQNK
ncbi:hypothetical protein CLU79DRAFT_677719, partial [Phycomyces nitens]